MGGECIFDDLSCSGANGRSVEMRVIKQINIRFFVFQLPPLFHFTQCHHQRFSMLKPLYAKPIISYQIMKHFHDIYKQKNSNSKLPPNLSKFNSFHMEPNWDPHISGIKPFRALKMDIPKEKFVNNKNLKVYWEIFNTSWVTGTQTWENNHFGTLAGFDRKKQDTFLI